MKHPENCRKLIIDPETAPIVKQIFQWAYEKASLYAIAKRLTESGVMTPSHAMRLAGIKIHDKKMSKNNKWNIASISEILASEVYVGDMVQGKFKNVSLNTRGSRR